MCHAEQGAEPTVLQGTSSPLSHVSSKGSASTGTLLPAATWTCWRYRPPPAMPQEDQLSALRCWKISRKHNQAGSGSHVHSPQVVFQRPQWPLGGSSKFCYQKVGTSSLSGLAVQKLRRGYKEDSHTLEGSLLLKAAVYVDY